MESATFDGHGATLTFVPPECPAWNGERYAWERAIVKCGSGKEIS
jgi:hypothetical protein